MKFLIFVSGIILIFFHFPCDIDSESSRHLACYCTSCYLNRSYCVTINGTCYKKNEGNNTTEYGCFDYLEKFKNCPVEPNRDINTKYFIPKTECCDNGSWCTTQNTDIVERLDLNLLDAELEYNYDQLGCYCRGCPKKTCRVNKGGSCFHETLNIYNNTPEYGCLDPELQFLCHYTPEMGYSKTKCCRTDDWCNWEYPLFSYNTIEKEWEIKTQRFEIIFDGYETAQYRYIVTNNATSRMQITLENLITKQIINRTGPHSITFTATRNNLYRFNATPIINNMLIKKLMKTVYFGRVQGVFPNWIPSSISYNRRDCTIFLCEYCYMTYDDEPRCLHCEKHVEKEKNPIWFVEENRDL